MPRKTTRPTSGKSRSMAPQSRTARMRGARAGASEPTWTAPLQLDDLPERGEAGAALQGIAHPGAARLHVGGDSAEEEHPGRQLDGERLEVLGPAALQGLDALHHLEGVAHRPPEGLLHVR